MEPSSPSTTQGQPQPPQKKKRGCCFGCTLILILLLAGILGGAGYLIYKSLPKKSAVEKEYNSVPDYFHN
ncbi:MAG TPA: hypothetical protein PLJ84_01690 [Bacteroidales bacterium]|nr:hypothetical protein [Bacteroidales bacterium]HPT01280.1 hypothetical protein [Bacteroidales bacterium]